MITFLVIFQLLTVFAYTFAIEYWQGMPKSVAGMYWILLLGCVPVLNLYLIWKAWQNRTVDNDSN